MFIVGTHLPICAKRRSTRRARRGLIATVVTIALAASSLAPLVAPLDRPAPARDHRGAPRVELGRDRAADHRRASPAGEQPARCRSRGSRSSTSSRCSPFRSCSRPAASPARCSGMRARHRRRGRVGSSRRGTYARRSAVERLRDASQRARVCARPPRLARSCCSRSRGSPNASTPACSIAGFAAGVMVAALGPPRRVARSAHRARRGILRPVVLRRARRAHRPPRARALAATTSGLLVLLVAAGRAGARQRPRSSRAADGVRPARGRAARRAGGRRAIGLSTGELRPGQAAAIVGARCRPLAGRVGRRRVGRAARRALTTHF